MLDISKLPEDWALHGIAATTATTETTGASEPLVPAEVLGQFVADTSSSIRKKDAQLVLRLYPELAGRIRELVRGSSGSSNPNPNPSTAAYAIPLLVQAIVIAGKMSWRIRAMPTERRAEVLFVLVSLAMSELPPFPGHELVELTWKLVGSTLLADVALPLVSWCGSGLLKQSSSCCFFCFARKDPVAE